MTRFIFLFLSLVSVSEVFAQNKFIVKGDQLMARFRFERAAALYKKVVDKEPGNLEAWEKLGAAFLSMKDNASAEAIFKTLSTNPLASPVNKFYYAQLLRASGKYDEAAIAYRNFASAATKDPRALEFKNFGEDVKPLERDSKVYELAGLPDNSDASEIGPAYNTGKLVFASNRSSGSGVRTLDFWSGRSYYDLYEQRSAGAGEVVTPAKMKGKVNRRLNEGPATFSRDGMEMIFTRSNYKAKGPNGVRSLGLYRADFDAAKNKWVNIQPLPFNNSTYNVAHPALSKDGSELYFISDMPGGVGESDIYVSLRNGSTWEQPINLGKEINTVGHEMFPFLADNGVFYFSSDARVGLGGLDIYYAIQAKNKKNNWGPVQNLGAIANSNADDFGYVSDETGKYGFLVSDREGGMGSDDIYKFTRIAEPVCGTIIDAKTKNTVANAVITMSSAMGRDHRTNTNSKGGFCLDLEPAKEYDVVADAEGYYHFSGSLTVKGTKSEHQIIAMEPKGGIDLVVDVSQKEAGILEGATAFLINRKTGEVIQQKSDSTGKVKFDLFKDQEYDLKVVKKVPGKQGVFDKFVKTISTMGFSPSQKLSEDVQLGYHEGELAFDLPNVYFDKNSNEIRPAAASDLDKVAKVMKEFPEMQVELSAHTDSRGNSNFNMLLSGQRAQACVNYLASKGVDVTHLIAIGFGEKRIRNRCKDNVECTDKEHAVNRRTEFKIAKFE